MEISQCIIAILTGFATVIPLTLKLIEYVKKSIKEKNWNKLLDLIISLMKEAEAKFDDGTTRKEWVLAMIKASSDSINYDINIDEVGTLIDNLCNMTKAVNCEKEEKKDKVSVKSTKKVGD